VHDRGGRRGLIPGDISASSGKRNGSFPGFGAAFPEKSRGGLKSVFCGKPQGKNRQPQCSQ
jgi:hypothetical protein